MQACKNTYILIYIYAICFFLHISFATLEMQLTKCTPNKSIQQFSKWSANRIGAVRPAELKHISVGLNLTAAVLSWFSCFEWILLLSYNINRTNTSNLKCFTDVCRILWALHFCLFLHNYVRNHFYCFRHKNIWFYFHLCL